MLGTTEKLCLLVLILTLRVWAEALIMMKPKMAAKDKRRAMIFLIGKRDFNLDKKVDRSG